MGRCAVSSPARVLRDCSAISNAAPIVRARTQVIYGNKNWVPLYIYGTTPEFLKVRDWQDFDEGEPFTEQDVRSAQSQWTRLGPIPAEVAGPLNERFQRAVRRFYDSRRKAS